MASTRDFQEYASSGELVDIKINGTANTNKVATIGDVPTDYISNSELINRFQSGAYTEIYLSSSDALNAVATKGYVQAEIASSGGYTDQSVKDYLSSTNDLLAIYIGSKTAENKVATLSDISTFSDYGDSDVITLLNSGTVPAIYVPSTTGKTKLKLATEKYVDDQNSEDLQKDVDAKYVTGTEYTAITADRGKTIYMTSTSPKSVSVSTSYFAADVQMAICNLSSSTIMFYTPGAALINGSSSDLLNAVPPYGIVYVTRYDNAAGIAGFLVG